MQNPTLSGEHSFGFAEWPERVVRLFVVEGVAAVRVDVGSLGWRRFAEVVLVFVELSADLASVGVVFEVGEQETGFGCSAELLDGFGELVVSGACLQRGDDGDC